jgi:hypothetical protein
MLETLEGRIKWEHTPAGLFVTIPVRRGATTVGYAGLVLVWLTIASIHYWHMMKEPGPESPEFMFQVIAVSIYAFGFFFFLAWLAWTLTGETVVMLDESELKIQKRAVGIELTSQSFRTHEVHSFNFIRPRPFWALRADTDPNSSKVRFTVAGKYHYFASGISEAEATALVEKMVTVYHFPGTGEQYWGAVTK